MGVGEFLSAPFRFIKSTKAALASGAWDPMADIGYKLKTWLSAGVGLKSLVLTIGFLIIYTFDAWLYTLFSKNEKGERAKMWHGYRLGIQMLTDVPGADCEEKFPINPVGKHTNKVNYFVFIQGVVLMGMFIGIVSDDIAGYFEEISQGEHQIREHGHTIVMNWNEKMVPVLRQLAVAKREGVNVGTPVVVLGDVAKEDMDDFLDRQLDAKDRKILRLTTRSGNPAQSAALETVSAPLARRVLVLRPGDAAGPPDEVSVRQAVALASARDASERDGALLPRQTTTVMSAESEAWEDVEDATANALLFFESNDSAESSKDSLLVVPEQAYISRMVAQAVFHPGITEAHEELAGSFHGCEFSTVSFERDLPAPYQRALRSTQGLTLGQVQLEGRAVVCGVLRQPDPESKDGKKVWLAPSGSLEVKGGDRLVLVSPGVKDVKFKAPLRPSVDYRAQAALEASQAPDWVKALRAHSGVDDWALVPEVHRRAAAAQAAKQAAKQGSQAAELAAAVAQVAPKAAAKGDLITSAKTKCERVLVLNWSPKSRGFLANLEQLAAKAGTKLEVTVMVHEEGHATHEELAAEVEEVTNSGRSSACQLCIVRGSSLRQADLLDAGAAKADTFVLLQPPELNGGGEEDGDDDDLSDGGDEADTIQVAALAQLHSTIVDPELNGGSIAPRRLVCEFSNPKAMRRTQAVLEESNEALGLWQSLDLFVPEDLESGCIVQVAMDDNLSALFGELMSNHVDLDLGGEVGKPTAFQELKKRVRAQNAAVVAANPQNADRVVLLGLKEPDGDMVLCPADDYVCVGDEQTVLLRFTSPKAAPAELEAVEA